MAPLEELITAYLASCDDESFQSELRDLLSNYAGRPTPLFHAARLTEYCGGARIYLKREDLLHTGAHKINNTIGQVLLARRMNKKRIVAETGAGQHGVATATVCALFGLDCVVYMGAEDMRRQALNVFRMQLLGAEVREVNAGSRTLKDAINEALRDWVTNVGDTYYLLGSALGPHPYPLMVRDYQSVIGREARAILVRQFPQYLQLLGVWLTRQEAHEQRCDRPAVRFGSSQRRGGQHPRRFDVRRIVHQHECLQRSVRRRTTREADLPVRHVE